MANEKLNTVPTEKELMLVGFKVVIDETNSGITHRLHFPTVHGMWIDVRIKHSEYILRTNGGVWKQEKLTKLSINNELEHFKQKALDWTIPEVGEVWRGSAIKDMPMDLVVSWINDDDYDLFSISGSNIFVVNIVDLLANYKKTHDSLDDYYRDKFAIKTVNHDTFEQIERLNEKIQKNNGNGTGYN